MYSSISSKIYIVKKIMSGPVFILAGEIWRDEYKQNLQIRHAATSATPVNQGLEPWVLQRPFARFLAAPRARQGLAPVLRFAQVRPAPCPCFPRRVRRGERAFPS